MASKKVGLDGKMIEPTIMNPIMASILQIKIQSASHSTKRTGRYVPLQNRRDKVHAISRVSARKTNKAENMAVSLENSV